MKRLCIVVPYRDREAHLKEFLPAIREKLKSQEISDYRILIVEQTFEKPFNRAKLLNVGFDYCKGEFDYFVFHDVDMLPMETADYRYCDCPTHLAAEAEQFGYRLPYNEYFGGVTLFDRESFSKVNGYANDYWGWGAEDDDMFRRCVKMGVRMMRKACRFRSLSHDRNIVQQDYAKNVQKLQAFESSFADGKFVEGLSTLKYTVLEEKNDSADYTHIKVSI